MLSRDDDIKLATWHVVFGKESYFCKHVPCVISGNKNMAVVKKASIKQS